MVVVLPPVVGGLGIVLHCQVIPRLVDRPPGWGLSVIPSPREGGGMVECDRFAVNEINQRGDRAEQARGS